jgi:hypothetical protein
MHPYSGQQGWKPLPQLTYQILLTPANQGLQQKGSPFSQISIKAYMHVQHKFKSKSKQVSNTINGISPQNAAQNTKNQSRKALSRMT